MKWDNDRIDREAQRRHGAYEPTDPPPRRPPSSSGPPSGRKPLGAFLKEHVGRLELKDLVYIGGLLFTALTWAQSRASKDEVDAARRACVDTTTAAIASAMTPIPPRLKAIEKRLARGDTRWDRLDAWHARAFSAPNRTPPPKFGPKAEARGEARYDDEEDE